MPAISLVVCLYNEGDLLQRLLERAQGCYDDLVVVHDGPDTTNVRAVVAAAGGQFFEGPREYQQEPHWPFAWGAAKHDWILRLDADEAPSPALREWLQNFRAAHEPPADLSGYLCIWPLWNGQQAVTRRWPDNRIFFFHRQRVRFFGMAEQAPEADGLWERVPLVLEHQPRRQSFGLRYVLLRGQSARWRADIAKSLLLESPMRLPQWRWENRAWPRAWGRIQECPVRTAFVRLCWHFPGELMKQWRLEGWPHPFAVMTSGLTHFLICGKYIQLRRQLRRSRKPQIKTAK